MLLLNRAATWPEINVAAANSADTAETDDDFENDLIALLCRLEHLRQRIVEASAARRPPQMLAQAHEFMELVAEFSGAHCPFGAGRERDDAVTRGKEFAALLADLQLQFAQAKSPVSDAVQFRRCFAALHGSVSAYFILFTNRFPTSRAARAWVEVAATFLVDLKHLANNPLPAA